MTKFEIWLQRYFKKIVVPAAGDTQEDCPPEVLLRRWASGAIEAKQRTSIIRHSVQCPRCREKIAALVRMVPQTNPTGIGFWQTWQYLRHWNWVLVPAGSVGAAWIILAIFLSPAAVMTIVPSAEPRAAHERHSGQSIVTNEAPASYRLRISAENDQYGYLLFYGPPHAPTRDCLTLYQSDGSVVLPAQSSVDTFLPRPSKMIKGQSYLIPPEQQYGGFPMKIKPATIYLLVSDQPLAEGLAQQMSQRLLELCSDKKGDFAKQMAEIVQTYGLRIGTEIRP
jgi:hypothetical protein